MMTDTLAIAQKIREAILNGQCFSKLGVYRFVDNTTVPAISIVSPVPFPPTGTIVEGFEVIIDPAHQITATPRLGLGSTMWQEDSKIELRNYGNGQIKDFCREVYNTLSLLGHTVIVSMNPKSESQGIIESCILSFKLHYYQ